METLYNFWVQSTWREREGGINAIWKVSGRERKEIWKSDNKILCLLFVNAKYRLQTNQLRFLLSLISPIPIPIRPNRKENTTSRRQFVEGQEWAWMERRIVLLICWYKNAFKDFCFWSIRLLGLSRPHPHFLIEGSLS